MKPTTSRRDAHSRVRGRIHLLAIGLAMCLVSYPVRGAGVIVRFDPTSPEIGPFPTDALTVTDPQQKTGRRMNMPVPDCQRQRSACEDLAAINQYDGFSLTPRIQVRFSGTVNVDTLREGIFLVALDNLTDEEFGLAPSGAVIPLNQLIYDPMTLSVYAKPDSILDQHRRYALIVTTGVRDRLGDPVEPDPEFLRCLTQRPGAYCEELASVVGSIQGLAERFAPSRRMVAASVLTTLSATAWMEKARDVLPNFPSQVRLAESKSVFAVPDVSSMVFRRQNRVNPPGFENVAVRTDLLGGVGRIAFASYRSPRFLNEQQLIPTTPTGAALSLPPETSEVFFNALLPASPKPPSGYPVVIAGHGAGDTRFGLAFAIADAMAAAGYATVAINTVGHGFGPDGRLIITEKNGTTTDLPAPGRGVDLNADGVIPANEGCGVGSFGNRDCLRQTALDLMQLIRAIRAGIDLDGDGVKDLDPDRIYYLGFSQGAMIGTILAAVEPNVPAAVLTAGGASVTDQVRWSPLGRPAIAALLQSRIPPIAPNKGSEFEDNYVLRYQPVKINDLPGAIEIQNIFEIFDWIRIVGDPLAYAPHLRSSTLPGVPIKRVLFQFGRGDQTAPNPVETALIRAANMREWSVLYRHDVARAAVAQLPLDPHRFIIGFWTPGTEGPLFSSIPAAAIAVAAHRQAAQFFSAAERCALDQPCVADVNEIVRPLFGRSLFEAIEVLPEDLGFLAP